MRRPPNADYSTTQANPRRRIVEAGRGEAAERVQETITNDERVKARQQCATGPTTTSGSRGEMGCDAQITGWVWDDQV
jgi:hypothetical protein